MGTMALVQQIPLQIVVEMKVGDMIKTRYNK